MARGPPDVSRLTPPSSTQPSPPAWWESGGVAQPAPDGFYPGDGTGATYGWWLDYQDPGSAPIYPS